MGQTGYIEVKFKTLFTLFQPFNFLCVVYKHDTYMGDQVTMAWWSTHKGLTPEVVSSILGHAILFFLLFYS